MPKHDLEGRTFVVTGANTGIGKETVRGLAARGGRVVLCCRSREKTLPVIDELRSQTGNDALSFVPLDLEELASVRRAAQQLLEEAPAIHVLINNAGLARAHGLTQDGFERTFGVNHLGHFLLTRLLLPRIEASGPARIVNVSSHSHYRAKRIDFDRLRQPTRTFTGMPEYEASKLCNVLFTQELARRLEGKPVTTYALHPGVIASDIWRNVPWPAGSIAKLFMKTNEEGAATSLYCATSEAVAAHSGRYYADCREKAPNRAANDVALARELWKKSSEWVGLD
ncbi:MAG: SDR family oxidoreductase [Myxococcales bacterium]|nr:SDR family oxidoreductase [Myxococcales bacterium]